MRTRRLKVIGQLLMVIPFVTASVAKAADQPGNSARIELAQLTPAEIEAKKKAEIEAKKKAEQNKQKPPTPRPPGQPVPQQAVPRPVPPRPPAQPVPQQAAPRPVPPPFVKPPPPPPVKQVTPPQTTAPVIKQVAPTPPPTTSPVPPAARTNAPPTPSAGGQVPFIPKGARSTNPNAANSVPPTPRTEGVNAPRGAVPFVPKPLPPSTQAAAPAPKLDQLKLARQTRVEAGGRRTVIQEPGNRVIIKQDNRIFIQHDEAARFKRLQNARTMQLPGGVQQTFYQRPDGFRVVTETDRNGRLLRRFRRGPDGREHVILDNRRFWRNVGIGVGVGAIATIIALNLRPPVITIPREHYIVDYERASDDDLYGTLIAPPLEPIERVYSLEEVRYSPELRDRMRRVDLDTITFDFGVSDVGPEQWGKLERLARSINRVLAENPDALLMIEGHTDAVGTAEDNLSLSDRRAQSVAQILTENFGVPPENMVTQGYGEQFLKVPTQEAERANRRVSVRNITRLVSQEQ